MNYSQRETEKRQASLVSKKNKIKTKFKIIIYRLFLVCFFALFVLGLGTGLGVINGILSSAPSIDATLVKPQGFSSTIVTQKGKTIQKLADADSNREYVSIDKIPDHLKNAFIAIEDSRFYEHNGIDIKGIARAALTGIKAKDFSQGASTITQQLIKNNIFGVGGEEKMMAKVERKIQEQYLAVKLEKQMSKSQILEDYLNTINLGQSTLGVQAASKRYFNKDVSKLTLSESTVIAAITQNPTKYNPITHPNNNSERRLVTLNYMLKDKMITQEEYNIAIKDNVYKRIESINYKQPESSSYSYFVDALISQVIDDMKKELGYSQTQAYNAIYSGGLKIYATQDATIQNICNNVFSDDSYFPKPTRYTLTYQLSIEKANGKTVNYSEYDVANYMLKKKKNATLVYDTKKEAKAAATEFKKHIVKDKDKVLGESVLTIMQPQSSFVLMDQHTGYVKAIVGGRGQKIGKLTLNRATDTTRQPGSTFKVVSTFVPALDTAGATLATAYDDCPYCYTGSTKSVNNYYSGYRGLSTIRDAIRDSMNIVTAKTMADVTPQVGYDYLLNMGITTLVDNQVSKDGTVFSDIQQSLCLGGITHGVTNLELTAAYASIANKGTYTTPVLYTKIVDRDGNVLIDNTPKEKQVMKDSTSWLLTNAMQDVITSGTATKGNLASGMPAAGKTGTTSNDYDHWFIGYTPYYTAGIWTGYDQSRTFYTSGSDVHIWKVIMDNIIDKKKLKVKSFPSCSSIETATICKKSGKLAVSGVCDCDPRGSMVRTEYFAKGTAPTETCDVHTKVMICKKSKLPISKYCPKKDQKSQVYIIRPKDSTGSTADSKYELPSKDFAKKKCNIHTKYAAEEKQKQKERTTTKEAATTTTAPPR